MSMWVSFTDNDSLGKREREIPFAQVSPYWKLMVALAHFQEEIPP